MNTWNKEGERAWRKRVKTTMTELNLFKQFAICSIELRESPPHLKYVAALPCEISDKYFAEAG